MSEESTNDSVKKGGVADAHGTAGSPRRPPPHYPPDWPSATELDTRPRRARHAAPGELPPLPRAVPRGREREAAILDALRRPGPRVVPNETPAPEPPSGRPSRNGYGPALLQWERENRSWPVRALTGLPFLRHAGVGALFISAAFLGGMTAVDQRGAELTADQLKERLAAAELAAETREGELALLRIELDRLRTVSENSASYGIPMDLAESIFDIALAEGIDPDLGYALIRVESEFYQRAVSPVGAVGLTQLMPTTAFDLDPTLQHSDLFRRETNLRLGFRYLNWLLERYDGDLRLALLAYNRGPGTVDSIRRQGLDPANGYASAVLSWAGRQQRLREGTPRAAGASRP